jgi:hypothetical protein
MSASYPGAIKSFITKVDNVDDVRAAHINDLQLEVAALETELGLNPRGLAIDLASRLTVIESGWIPLPVTPIYVSATVMQFNGVDLTALLKIGVKFRWNQSGLKYSYVLSSSYAGGNTTLNLVPTTDYSVASAPITDAVFSYGNPADFPGYFNYLATVSGTTGTSGAYTESVSTAIFGIYARFCKVQVGKFITNLGSWSGNVKVLQPLPAALAPSRWSPLCAIYPDAATIGNPKAIGSPSTAGYFGFSGVVDGASFGWASMVANSWLQINDEFPI